MQPDPFGSISTAITLGNRIAAHVDRPRLVELSSTGGVVVLEAPAGAGKSTLVRDLADAHDGPTLRVELREDGTGPNELQRLLQDASRRSGLNELAAGLEQAPDAAVARLITGWVDAQAEPTLLIIDDLQRADIPLQTLLAEVVGAWTPSHQLVLAGRRLPDGLREVATGHADVHVGPAELRFDAVEARALLGPGLLDRPDRAEVALLTERCDGWAAALVLAANQLQRAQQQGPDALDTELAHLLSASVTLPQLLDELLADVPPGLRVTIRDLAALPYLDDELVEAAGVPDGAVTMAAVGLPIVSDGPTRWQFPDSIRDVLANDVPGEPLARIAAAHYLTLDDGSAAMRVLRRARLDADLAKLLAELPPRLSGTLDAGEQAAAVNSLPPPLLAAHPHILIHLADTYIVAGDQASYRRSIQRARELIGGAGLEDPDLPPVALEVLAADLTMRAVATDDDRLVPTIEELLLRPTLPPMARGRLLGALGRAMASRRTVPDLRAALTHIDQAAQVYDRQGATIHATAIRAIGATYVAWPLGDYDAALELLDGALQATRGSLRARVAILPFRAFVLIDLGRYAEAEATLSELRRTATTVDALGNDRSAAFARWGAAKLASQRDDADGTWAACHAVEHAEVAVDTGHGAFFLADAAQLLARVGRHDDARRLITAAHERDPGTTPLVTTAALAVAAHGGALADVEAALTQLDDGRAVEPRERWRVTMLHAYACHRAGDARAGALAAAAFEQAGQLGMGDLPMIREPQMAQALLPLAMRSSASARDAASHQGARVRLFDRYEVVIDGTTIEPTGRPGQLLALLVLRDGQLPVEQAIDLLWPDTDLKRGRERLRTVLRRLRREVGELIERHEHTLRLVDGVHADTHEFLVFVEQARHDRDDDAASAALALYRGDLAASLGADEWAEENRRRLRLHALGLVDLLVATAEQEGRLDDAVRLLRDATVREPLDEQRQLVLARLLAEQGRRSSALRVLTDARAALQAAGLVPGAELERFEAYLRRDPAVR